MKKVFISIVNYNGNKDTVECLLSLSKLNKKDFDLYIVVIDNNSKEPFEVQDKLSSDMNLKIIHNKINLGFAGAHNLVIKYALKKGADYVLILNNDTEADSNLLIELLEPFHEDHKVGITAPLIYFYKGSEFHKNRYKESDKGKVIWYAGGVTDWKNVIGFHKGVDQVNNGQYDTLTETDFASGCCMLVKKEVFEKVGLLNEQYFLYYEDSDFNERVKKSEYKILFAPQSILWHKNANSSGGSGSILQDYYITRNRLLFGLKYAPFRSKLALMKESIRMFFKGRKWQRKGVIDFYLGRLGKGSYV